MWRDSWIVFFNVSIVCADVFIEFVKYASFVMKAFCEIGQKSFIEPSVSRRPFW